MVVDNFPWNKKNMKSSKMESQFYKAFIDRIADAASRKFEEKIDTTAKRTTLHFYGIPATVLGIVKEEGAFDSNNAVSIYRELIGRILSLGIVDSALLNKTYLKKNQEAALKILFRVLLQIFTRINGILESADLASSDDELIAKIRQISDEEWSPNIYLKIEESLNNLDDCDALITYRKLQQEKRVKQKLMKARASVSSPLPANRKPIRVIRSSRSEILQTTESASNTDGKKERIVFPDSSSKEAEKENCSGDRLCVKETEDGPLTPPPHLSPVNLKMLLEDDATPPLTPKKLEIVLDDDAPPQLEPMNVEVSLEDGEISTSPSLTEMPILVFISGSGEESPAIETPATVADDDKQSPLCSPHDLQNASPSIKKEPSPEIEILGDVRRYTPKSTVSSSIRKRKRVKRPTTGTTVSSAPFSGVNNRMNLGAPAIASPRLCSAVMNSVRPLMPVSVATSLSSLTNFPHTISTISGSISSPTEQRLPMRFIPPEISSVLSTLSRTVTSVPVVNRQDQAFDVSLYGSQQIGSYQPTPFTSGSMLNSGLRAHRTKEISTLMTVLNKFASELASQVVESHDRLPGAAVSFKCSIGNPESSLFVGFSTRQDTDIVECRFWALVQLYQNLQLIFPSFVLDDIRTSAINGAWAKIDAILHNCKPLFKYAVDKIGEIAAQSRFSTSSELQLLLQQRLLVTQALESASRKFWALPANSTVSASRLC